MKDRKDFYTNHTELQTTEIPTVQELSAEDLTQVAGGHRPPVWVYKDGKWILEWG